METKMYYMYHLNSLIPPYSLGKLIEWKLDNLVSTVKPKFSPYSLGKLIEWKPINMKPSTIIVKPEFLTNRAKNEFKTG